MSVSPVDHAQLWLSYASLGAEKPQHTIRFTRRALNAWVPSPMWLKQLKSYLLDVTSISLTLQSTEQTDGHKHKPQYKKNIKRLIASKEECNSFPH